MRLRGWVSFSKLAAGSLSSASCRRKHPAAAAAAAATLCRQKHVCRFSQSGANMAEEAKKLAAYAAVDNHVQVHLTCYITSPQAPFKMLLFVILASTLAKVS